MPEASLTEAGSGLVPASDGWFVVNAAEAAWVGNPDFGWRCSFEANGPALRESPELEQVLFAQLGFRLHVLEPGRPSGLYHAESEQEDFVVLAGECLLVVEEEERHLRAWDFVHCPPGTGHIFVRDPHDRRAVGRGHDPLPALRGGRSTRRRRRGRDVLAARGVFAPSPLAARASRDSRPSLGGRLAWPAPGSSA